MSKTNRTTMRFHQPLQCDFYEPFISQKYTNCREILSYEIGSFTIQKTTLSKKRH